MEPFISVFDGVDGLCEVTISTLIVEAEDGNDEEADSGEGDFAPMSLAEFIGAQEDIRLFCAGSVASEVE